MVDPVLASGQYDIDGTVFGRGTEITVASTVLTPPALSAQDQPLSGRDGLRFGVDYQTTGTDITFTGNVLVDPSDRIGALDVYAQFAAGWNDPAVRLTPGSVSQLRLRYPNSSVTKRVIGRGRSIAPALGSVSQGVVPFVAAFNCADGNFYDDVATSRNLRLAPTYLGTPVNLIQNPSFEQGTVNWTPTGCTLIQDSTQKHSGNYSGKITPNGSTANPTVSALGATVLPSTGYGQTLWVYPAVTLSVPIGIQLAYYDSTATLITTVTSSFVTPTAGVWTPLSFAQATPSNAQTVVLSLRYNGTPAVTDIVWLDDAYLFNPNGGATPPFTPPVLLATEAGGGTSLALDNTGTQYTFPTFAFSGPVTNPQVAIPDLGVSLKLATAIPAATVVTVDMQPWTSTVLDQHGNSYAGYYVGNAFSEFAIPPGSWPVQFSGQDPSAQAACLMSWRNATAAIGGTY